MPSINEIIERVGQLRPDAYDDSSKAGWLIELDGKIYREVILRHRLTPGVEAHGPVGVCPECGSSEIFYDSGMDCSSCQACRWSELPKLVRSYPEDGDVPLLVPAPYDNLYSQGARRQQQENTLRIWYPQASLQERGLCLFSGPSPCF